MVTRSPPPVSYTHLDVYKRQLSDRKHWLITYQTDFDGKLRPNEPYGLLLGDGLTRIGFTDRMGAAVDELLPDGPCAVELVPLSAPPR